MCMYITNFRILEFVYSFETELFSLHVYVYNKFSHTQALHQWRDYIARQQDESTGYVLPNKALIEIGITYFFLFHLVCHAS